LHGADWNAFRITYRDKAGTRLQGIDELTGIPRVDL